MSARDSIHDAVKTALIKDGWADLLASVGVRLFTVDPLHEEIVRWLK